MRSDPARLFWLLIAVATVGLPASFAIERTGFFSACCEKDWLRANEAAFRVRGTNCETVIYGDSSAIVGLDPQVIQTATHLKTCNIAQTGGVRVVLGLDPLDRFLATSARPRFLVLQFHPNQCRVHQSWDEDASLEGFISLIKFYPAYSTALAAIRHPDAVLGLAHNVFARGIVVAMSHRGPRRDITDAHYQLPEPPLRDCVPPSVKNTAVPDREWLKSLRARYADKADHLIVNISPGGSACHSPAEQIRAAAEGLTDNRYEVLPLAYFADEADHPSQAGIEYLSTQVARQISRTQTQIEGGHRAL